ncbi:MAG: efflux RND transporter periplasmic adaptor subunit [Gemmatimonadota bacterium]
MRAARSAVLSALALVACRKDVPPQPQAVAVTVATAERKTMPFVLSATGTVEPLQSVAVQAQVGGELTRVLFREGDEVRAGQPLFEIDPRAYEAALAQAKARLQQSRAQLELARRDAARAKELVANDYITRQQYESLQTNEAALAAAVAAGEAAVRTAELDLQFATIRAPIAGRTGQLLVKRGNVVRPNAGLPLVTINQMRPILVRFALPADHLSLVRQHLGTGATVKALPPGASAPSTGRLRFVDNAVDSATGTIQLKGEFANTDGALWPGQFVSVRLELFNERDALVVPSKAVVTGQQGPYVFVVDSANRAKVRQVTVSRTQDSLAVVTAGLAAGDRVVTDGQVRLRPGSRVEIKG